MSYTQRLENRIKDLERQLAATKTETDAGASPPKSAADHFQVSSSASPSGPDESVEGSEEALVGSFSGMKIDEKGVITYHGNTSFFQLPHEGASVFAMPSREPDASAVAPLCDPETQRRQRLVTNAWQQRALEDMSATPVSGLHFE